MEIKLPDFPMKEITMICEFRTDALEVCKPKIREYRAFILKRPCIIHLRNKEGDIDFKPLWKEWARKGT